ncbi:MAG: SHOCT domain-containing protein, partial [Dermatophilaceae bacterium]
RGRPRLGGLTAPAFPAERRTGLPGSPGVLHRFYMVSRHERCTRARRLRYPGGTGQTKEELTMMGWYGGGMSAFGWLAMGLFWLILLGLIVWLVSRLLPGSGVGTTRSSGESALEILDRRLAGGEIDLETWQAQRAALVAAQRDKR